MGIIAKIKLMIQRSLAPSVLDDYWYNPVGKKILSGVQVDENTAMNYSAVWAASRLITESLATLPKVLYKRDSNGRQAATSHPTYRVLHSEPNPEQSSQTFFAQQTNFALNWGNCYAEIIRDQLGRTVQLWPIHPNRIPPHHIKRNKIDENVDIRGGGHGELVYFVKNNNLTTTPILKRNMFHLPGALSEDGITGKGIITQAAESIGMGIATERFGASFFGEGAAPSIIMTHPGKLGEDALNNLRKSWQKRFNGPGKTNGLLIAEDGMSVERLTIPPDQAQFLETRSFNVAEIARWYSCPPHMIGDLSRATFSNIEQQNLNFVTFTMMNWVTKWESELDRQVLTESDKSQYFFKFTLQALLRGDMASRAKFYKDLWFMGVFSVNDILEFEDRNTIGKLGDFRYVQKSMVTLEEATATADKAETPPADLNALVAALIEQTKLARTKSWAEPLAITEAVAATKTVADIDLEPAIMFHRCREAVRLMFSCEFGRIVRKEAKGARWAAEKPREFQSRLDTWYEKHKVTYQSSELVAVFDAIQTLGVTCDVGEFAAEQIESSYTELIEKSGEVTVTELAGAIEDVVTHWEKVKIDQVAAKVLTPN